MKIPRRQMLQLLSSIVPMAILNRSFAQNVSVPNLPITPGRFTGTLASLKAYSVPTWFADAKFGIWSHWGPQSAIGQGDWYARSMYVEGSADYKYHLQRFGPQSKIGYKDTIPLFTADKWDPEHLMDLYSQAGAKYFFSMGVHHDNYDMWNSKYQPRWNAVSTGPKRDIVGEWAAAARRRGLRFGVSEHLSNSYDWFAPSHLSDTHGPYAGIPYDGADSKFSDLYHDYAGEPADFAKVAKAMGRVAPDRWKMEYFRRVKDLLDQHQPDLLYTDGGIPFEDYGLATVAEIYNVGPTDSRGAAEGVYFSKNIKECAEGTCTVDRERGVSDTIWPTPWQTDTCIGTWHYKVGQKYKSPKKVIDLLVDIISKNGNLLLNFPLPASGELDPEEKTILTGITEWMRTNGEAIYATRPWKINGEGPAMKVVVPSTGAEYNPNENKKPDLGPKDIRFTSKGKTLFAFVQGWPQGSLTVAALGLSSPQEPGKVMAVQMLGRNEFLRFRQEASGLTLTLPSDKPATADIGIALKVSFV